MSEIKDDSLTLSNETKLNPLDHDVIDFGAVLNACWRGKWLIIMSVLLAVLVGGVYSYVIAVPKFTSAAVVMLETRQENVVNLESVVGGLTGDTAEVNSELEVLRSRGLMAKVVDKLNLVEDPEFNARLRSPSLITTFKSASKRQIKAVLGIEEVTVEASEAQVTRATRDRVIGALSSRVSVFNVPKTLVFQIRVQTESPTKSALIADTVVDQYILSQIEAKFDATEQATTWLAGRVSELKLELEAAEDKVGNFKSSGELISEEVLESQEDQLKSLRDRRLDAETRKADSEILLSALKSASDRETRAKVSGDLQLQRLLKQVANDSGALEQFDRVFQGIVEDTEVRATRASRNYSSLTSTIDTLSEKLKKQSDDLLTLQQLTREAEAVRILFEYFLTRLKETSIQEGIHKPDSRILSSATLPNGASAPRKSLILAMSAFLGALMGLALVLLRSSWGNGFRSAQEVEWHTKFPVLGQVPLFKNKSRRKILEYLISKPSSEMAEAVRNLRTSLVLKDEGFRKIIAITSSKSGEGKTVTSMALARNFAGVGQKVLLIEGDIRRQTLTSQLDPRGRPGLVSVLTGRLSLDQALYADDRLGCDILGGEPTTINAADLFAGDQFKRVLDNVRNRYDIIIIDTPPIPAVADARLIASHADAVLLTVKWNATSVKEFENTLRIIKIDNLPLVGIALTQINQKLMQRYGFTGYSADQSSYYVN